MHTLLRDSMFRCTFITLLYNPAVYISIHTYVGLTNVHSELSLFVRKEDSVQVQNYSGDEYIMNYTATNSA